MTRLSTVLYRSNRKDVVRQHLSYTGPASRVEERPGLNLDDVSSVGELRTPVEKGPCIGIVLHKNKPNQVDVLLFSHRAHKALLDPVLEFRDADSDERDCEHQG